MRLIQFEVITSHANYRPIFLKISIIKPLIEIVRRSENVYFY